MNSIGMKVTKYFKEDKLLIHPLENPALDEDCEFAEDPQRLLGKLALQIERIPKEREIIIVDAITNLASYCPDSVILRFFSSCKRLCKDKRTIILSAHSYAFDEKMLVRFRDLCDAHISLGIETIANKTATMLEVSKAHNAKLNRDNTVALEVVPGVGMNPLPFNKVRA